MLYTLYAVVYVCMLQFQLAVNDVMLLQEVGNNCIREQANREAQASARPSLRQTAGGVPLVEPVILRSGGQWYAKHRLSLVIISGVVAGVMLGKWMSLFSSIGDVVKKGTSIARYIKWCFMSPSSVRENGSYLIICCATFVKQARPTESITIFVRAGFRQITPISRVEAVLSVCCRMIKSK